MVSRPGIWYHCPIERSAGNRHGAATTHAQPATARQRDLLDAAATLFREKGYAGATTRELASVLGMQSASLYHHIASKDDLLYTLCEEAVQRMLAAARAAVAAEDDPAARMRAVIAAHVCTGLADQDTHATMLGELRSLPPERREQVVALRDEYETLIRDVLVYAQEAGAVRRDISAHDLTLVLLSLLNWPIFWFRPDGDLTPEALAGLLATIFLEGVATT